MITSKQIINLSETFVGSEKNGNRFVEVFSNPTPNELLKISEPSFKRTGKREIRFVLSSNKKEIYIADAYNSLHPDMRRILDIDVVYDFGYIYGEAIYNGVKFVLKEAYCGIARIRNNVKYQDEVKNFLDTDWTWADKYVNGISNYANQKKRELK